MPLLKQLEQDYIIGDLKIYTEFDNSSFVSSARTAVTGKPNSVMNLNMDTHYYSEMLQTSINEFSNTELDPGTIEDFLTNPSLFIKATNSRITVSLINYNDVSTVKPQYLKQFIAIAQNIIDKALHDNLNENEYFKIISKEYSEKVKKQIVKTLYRYDLPTNELMSNIYKDMESNPAMILNDWYIKNDLIPFITNFSSLKNSTLNEANNLLNILKSTETTVTAMNNALNKLKTENSWSVDKLQKINQISYNTLRSILDVVSFVTFMMIHKMNLISRECVSIDKIHNNILNLHSVDEVLESDMNIVATDTHSLGEGLMRSHVDAYRILANNIYDFYASIPGVNTIDDIRLFTKDIMNKTDGESHINTKLYDDIKGVYMSIGIGLNTLAKEGDEYLMIFDDIIEKSGFTLPIDVRFKNNIESINDMSGYNSNTATGCNVDKDMFITVLNEVYNFPAQIQEISDIAAENYKKITMLQDRFSRNTNIEYSDIETINELNLFLSSFKESYEMTTRQIASNFYNRLKKLGEILSELSTSENTDSTQLLNISDSPMLNESVDFLDYAFESILDDIKMDDSGYFRALETSYYIEMNKVMRGVDVVIEADNSTKPVVSDNSNSAQSTSTNNNKNNSGNTTGLIANIKIFMNNIIDKFRNIVVKSKNKNNNWMREHQDGIINRSYSNVSVQILPYYKIKSSEILSDISSVKDNVRKMTLQSLQNIKDVNSLYGALCPKVPNLKSSDNKESLSIAKQIENYYSTGANNGKKEMVTVANSDLKQIITSDMVPYCNDYNEKFYNSIKSALNELGKISDDMIESYGGKEGINANDNNTNTVEESISIFTEADNNSEPNIKTKANWLKMFVKTYTGAILNTIRNRYNDYLTVLNSLAPKTKTSDASNNNNTAETTNSSDEVEATV